MIKFDRNDGEKIIILARDNPGFLYIKYTNMRMGKAWIGYLPTRHYKMEPFSFRIRIDNVTVDLKNGEIFVDKVS